MCIPPPFLHWSSQQNGVLSDCQSHTSAALFPLVPKLELSSASLHLANSYSLGSLPTHICLLLVRDGPPSGGFPKHPVLPQPRSTHLLCQMVVSPEAEVCAHLVHYCFPATYTVFNKLLILINVSLTNLKCSGPLYRAFQLWYKYCPYTPWLPHILATLPATFSSTPSINLDRSPVSLDFRDPLFSLPLLALLNTKPVNWFISQTPPNWNTFPVHGFFCRAV